MSIADLTESEFREIVTDLSGHGVKVVSVSGYWVEIVVRARRQTWNAGITFDPPNRSASIDTPYPTASAPRRFIAAVWQRIEEVTS